MADGEEAWNEVETDASSNSKGLQIADSNTTSHRASAKDNEGCPTTRDLIVVFLTLCLVGIGVAIGFGIASSSSSTDDSSLSLAGGAGGAGGMNLDSLDSSGGAESHFIHHRRNYVPGPQKNVGKEKSVIRDPTDVPLPINIRYTPEKDENGSIVYYQTLDANGLQVPKPKCQNDFDTSTYTMKDFGYSYPDDCLFPLPASMDEADIIALPRRREPIIHRITIYTLQVIAEIEKGHTFEFMTYNGTVPGPPIRVMVGDWIDMTLVNPADSTAEHSIDFHAMSGPGGGAASLRVNPGEQARTMWKAIYPGMFIYHCASGWISDHISKGMYGAIIVETQDGFPYSDMDIYLGQGELYLQHPLVNHKGTGFGLPPPDMHGVHDAVKELYELSDVVMFNGAPFGLFSNPIRTLVGSVVRAFMVLGGPNHISSWHIIGDHWDRVWLHADFVSNPQQNVQTTTVPPGGCSVVDWRHDNPGNYIFVDHALTRTFVKGNIGIIRACEPTDTKCLAAGQGGWNGADGPAGSYPCKPSRYDSGAMEGNTDCTFCGWKRQLILSEEEANAEFDEVFEHLKNAESCTSHNGGGGGLASAFADDDKVIFQGPGMRGLTHYWGKKTFGTREERWTLNRGATYADHIEGNVLAAALDPEPSVFDYQSPGAECDKDLLADKLTLEASLMPDGSGSYTFTFEKPELLGDEEDAGGYFSFGRGGNDGQSLMLTAHVVSFKIFKERPGEHTIEYGHIVDYAHPRAENTKARFTISDSSIEIGTSKVTISFTAEGGDWVKPPEGWKYVPLIWAYGPIMPTGRMLKHTEQNRFYLDPTPDKQECLITTPCEVTDSC